MATRNAHYRPEAAHFPGLPVPAINMYLPGSNSSASRESSQPQSDRNARPTNAQVPPSSRQNQPSQHGQPGQPASDTHLPTAVTPSSQVSTYPSRVRKSGCICLVVFVVLATGSGFAYFLLSDSPNAAESALRFVLQGEENLCPCFDIPDAC